MAEARVQRKLTAILAADVVGYSRLMGADEVGTLAELKTLRTELLDPKVAEYGGRIVKTTGDGILIEFPSAVDAVEYAVDVQRSLGSRNAPVPDDRRIQLRIGINLGDVIVDGDDLYGDGVNIAARLEGLAKPGSIFVSEMTYGSVRNKLDVTFTDLGEHSLKNIVEPVHVYRVEQPDGGTDTSATPAVQAIFRRPAVAVLPFQNLSGDPEQEYFADGLTEDIITALSMWKSFPVIARNSTFSYKGQISDIRKVGSELGARYILEGSVRKAGNRVRTTAQLINAETGHHAWAERYDRELSEIFDLQDEMTHRIVATLVPELERAEREKSAAKAPANLDAWDYYLRGAAATNDLNPASIPRARELLQRAIDLEPGYAKAYAKLALSYHRELWLNLCPNPAAAAKTMLEHARAAVQFDEGDAFSHTLHALALVWHGQIDRPIEELKRAIALNPIDVDATFSAGTALVWAGRPAEGIPHIENTLRISPHDPRSATFYSQLAGAYFDAGAHEAALDWAQKALDISADAEINANTSFARLIRIASLIALDRLDDAKAAAEEVGSLAQDFRWTEGLFRLRLKATTRQHIVEALETAGLNVGS
jgi:adenylate cyclase